MRPCTICTSLGVICLAEYNHPEDPVPVDTCKPVCEKMKIVAYDNSTTLKLAHIFPVDNQLVHARAGDIFLGRKYLVEAQLVRDCSQLRLLKLEHGARPIEIRVLLIHEVLYKPRHAGLHLILVDLRV